MEFLHIFVYLLGVFIEVFAILEQLLATLTKTLEDSKGLCLVSRHVQLVTVISFEVGAAHETRVENGGVHSFLVPV
jgi:hypothetical protein